MFLFFSFLKHVEFFPTSKPWYSLLVFQLKDNFHPFHPIKSNLLYLQSSNHQISLFPFYDLTVINTFYCCTCLKLISLHKVSETSSILSVVIVPVPTRVASTHGKHSVNICWMVSARICPATTFCFPKGPCPTHCDSVHLSHCWLDWAAGEGADTGLSIPTSGIGGWRDCQLTKGNEFKIYHLEPPRAKLTERTQEMSGEKQQYHGREFKHLQRRPLQFPTTFYFPVPFPGGLLYPSPHSWNNVTCSISKYLPIFIMFRRKVQCGVMFLMAP